MQQRAEPLSRAQGAQQRVQGGDRRGLKLTATDKLGWRLVRTPTDGPFVSQLVSK